MSPAAAVMLLTNGLPAVRIELKALGISPRRAMQQIVDDNCSTCIIQSADDIDGVLHTRIVNLLSHGNHSLYEPREMMDENKERSRRILHEFIERYPFGPALFSGKSEEVLTS